MKKKILIVCTGNSCRSQMAEGFLRDMGGIRFDVYSAGVNPTSINPRSMQVMDEIGIDISSQKSQSVMEFIDQHFDYVITVCDNAKQTCPVYPGKHTKLHWNLKDPADAEGTEEEILDDFRRIRDQIKKYSSDFLTNS